MTHLKQMLKTFYKAITICLLSTSLLTIPLIARPHEQGVASWYSAKAGTKTASGEKLVDSKLTAAHRTLKFGTIVKVTDTSSNKSVMVKITDRGPYVKGRIIDLSKGAAHAIGLDKKGLAKVKVEVIDKKS